MKQNRKKFLVEIQKRGFPKSYEVIVSAASSLTCERVAIRKFARDNDEFEQDLTVRRVEEL